MNTTLWRTHLVEVDAHEVGRQWLERMGWSCDRAMQARAKIPAPQVTDVAFAESVADPIGVAGNVLSAIGLELTDESMSCMQAWLRADRRRESLPVHRYTAEDFGLTPGQINERFADYRARFL